MWHNHRRLSHIPIAQMQGGTRKKWHRLYLGVACLQQLKSHCWNLATVWPKSIRECSILGFFSVTRFLLNDLQKNGIAELVRGHLHAVSDSSTFFLSRPWQLLDLYSAQQLILFKARKNRTRRGEHHNPQYDFHLLRKQERQLFFRCPLTNCEINQIARALEVRENDGCI